MQEVKEENRKHVKRLSDLKIEKDNYCDKAHFYLSRFSDMLSAVKIDLEVRCKCNKC